MLFTRAIKAHNKLFFSAIEAVAVSIDPLSAAVSRTKLIMTSGDTLLDGLPLALPLAWQLAGAQRTFRLSARPTARSSETRSCDLRVHGASSAGASLREPR